MAILIDETHYDSPKSKLVEEKDIIKKNKLLNRIQYYIDSFYTILAFVKSHKKHSDHVWIVYSERMIYCAACKQEIILKLHYESGEADDQF